jgi:hypothetical protein
VSRLSSAFLHQKKEKAMFTEIVRIKKRERTMAAKKIENKIGDKREKVLSVMQHQKVFVTIIEKTKQDGRFLKVMCKKRVFIKSSKLQGN